MINGALTAPLPVCVTPPAPAFRVKAIVAVSGASMAIEPLFAVNTADETVSGALIVIDPVEAVRLSPFKVTA